MTNFNILIENIVNDSKAVEAARKNKEYEEYLEKIKVMGNFLDNIDENDENVFIDSKEKTITVNCNSKTEKAFSLFKYYSKNGVGCSLNDKVLVDLKKSGYSIKQFGVRTDFIEYSAETREVHDAYIRIWF